MAKSFDLGISARISQAMFAPAVTSHLLGRSQTSGTDWRADPHGRWPLGR